MVLRDIFKTQIIEKILYLQPGELIIIEISNLSKPFYKVNVIPLKIHQEIIYLGTWENNSKIYLGKYRAKNSQSTSEEDDQ